MIGVFIYLFKLHRHQLAKAILYRAMIGVGGRWAERKSVYIKQGYITVYRIQGTVITGIRGRDSGQSRNSAGNV